VHAIFDGAGVLLNERYDRAGNVVETSRRLTKDGKRTPDWSPAALAIGRADAVAAVDTLLSAEAFTTRARFDALGRPEEMRLPDQSVVVPEYGQRALLARLSVMLRGLGASRSVVEALDYDARGEVTGTHLANGIVTTRDFDPLSQRLRALKATRTSDGARLQALRYHHDAAGNVVRVRDAAGPDAFLGSPRATGDRDYEHDALYRLVLAFGSEHASVMQDGGDLPIAHPADRQALNDYRETYEYDAAGNLLRLVHRVLDQQGPQSVWTRRYAYDSARNNRLLRTTGPGDGDGPPSQTYAHDAHGNMIKMPHLPRLDWTLDDRLREVDLEGGGVAYYAYDAAGERVRKVVEERGGIVKERIYLGDFELYREHRGDRIELERETLHLRVSERVASFDTRTRGVSSGAAAASDHRFVVGDRLGSVTAECDERGRVVRREEYHPFGTSALRAPRAETNTSRYRYIGRERDEETKLGHHGVRQYAPWLGRWTSADPAGMVDGPNLYTYARDNPVTQRDANGRQSGRPLQVPEEHSVYGYNSDGALVLRGRFTIHVPPVRTYSGPPAIKPGSAPTPNEGATPDVKKEVPRVPSSEPNTAAEARKPLRPSAPPAAEKPPVAERKPPVPEQPPPGTTRPGIDASFAPPPAMSREPTPASPVPPEQRRAAPADDAPRFRVGLPALPPVQEAPTGQGLVSDIASRAARDLERATGSPGLATALDAMAPAIMPWIGFERFVHGIVNLGISAGQHIGRAIEKAERAQTSVEKVEVAEDVLWAIAKLALGFVQLAAAAEPIAESAPKANPKASAEPAEMVPDGSRGAGGSPPPSAGGRPGGKPFSGTAYELRHIAKHLEGTAAAERLIGREGAAHVFPDMATFEIVENAIFGRGEFTGVVRGTERFGLTFEAPIGYRVAADGSRIPLFYGEAKVSPSGLYHVVPRTRPSGN
jgi:RHS repeat-associated protein